VPQCEWVLLFLLSPLLERIGLPLPSHLSPIFVPNGLSKFGLDASSIRAVTRLSLPQFRSGLGIHPVTAQTRQPHHNVEAKITDLGLLPSFQLCNYRLLY
jgi:hypothetical protein